MVSSGPLKREKPRETAVFEGNSPFSEEKLSENAKILLKFKEMRKNSTSSLEVELFDGDFLEDLREIVENSDNFKENRENLEENRQNPKEKPENPEENRENVEERPPTVRVHEEIQEKSEFYPRNPEKLPQKPVNPWKNGTKPVQKLEKPKKIRASSSTSLKISKKSSEHEIKSSKDLKTRDFATKKLEILKEIDGLSKEIAELTDENAKNTSFPKKTSEFTKKKPKTQENREKSRKNVQVY